MFPDDILIAERSERRRDERQDEQDKGVSRSVHDAIPRGHMAFGPDTDGFKDDGNQARGWFQTPQDRSYDTP